MKKLLLHIGLAKTGSSAIQKYLYVNKKVLATNGILIPKTLYNGTHGWLAYAANKRNKLWPDDKIKDFLNEENIHASSTNDAREKLFEYLQKQTQNWRGLCIMSSETFHLTNLTHIELQDLERRLSQIFDEVQIVAYVRNPVKVATSLLSTLCMTGNAGPISTVKEIEEKQLDLYCAHKEILKDWLSIFQDRLKVRLYTREEITSNNIVEDFHNQIQSSKNLIGSFSTKEDANYAMSEKAMIVMAETNKYLPKWIKGGRNNSREWNTARDNIANIIRDLFSDYPEYELKQEELLLLANRYKESNDWLQSKFFPEKESLWKEKENNTDKSKETQKTTTAASYLTKEERKLIQAMAMNSIAVDMKWKNRLEELKNTLRRKHY